MNVIVEKSLHSVILTSPRRMALFQSYLAVCLRTYRTALSDTTPASAANIFGRLTEILRY